jgi:hypothetical protein
MIGRRAPTGIYEGAWASRNPYASLIPGTVVGSVDIACGRFGWRDASGECSNAQSAGSTIGLVQPQWGAWGLTYISRGVRFVRAGKPITLAASGDFYVRFPNGASIGASVWADPATGIAYAADAGGYQLTKWKAATNVAPGGLGIISPYGSIN